MDFKQVITDENLPHEWNNVIVAEKSTKDVIYIRCSISNLDDCKSWVNAFSRNTSTQWKSRSSKPNRSHKLVCQKIYVCHHSSYQKRPTDEKNHNKRGISKNTDCLANMSVSVKITSRYTKRADPYIKDGLPGVIVIRVSHNHPLDSAYSLKCLAPTEHIKEEFLKYFKLGMNIAAACHYHENTLVFKHSHEDFSKDDSRTKYIESILNNSRLNPSRRMVQYWFERWKNVENDPRDGSFIKEKLEDKILTYELEDVIIKYIDNEKDPFTMVIITPMMRRMHRYLFSESVLFIDSTSCCYPEKYSITFLLSPAPCGVVPCGVLVTKDQTEDSFEKGFRLFQNTVKDKIGSSFSKQNYPSIIFSDNLHARAGAEKVWPGSTSFICTFRALQHVSLWLENSKDEIPEQRRRDLLATFQTILYCADKSEAENAFESALAIGDDYPEWQDFLRDFYTLKEKWCLAYRVGVISLFMSNYVEISIRLYKETVLNRVKMYNIVMLVEFVASTMESFYRKKLLNFYHSKDCENHLYLQYVFQKSDRMQKENITLIDEHTYGVPSENTSDAYYAVDIRGNTCNCKIGQMKQLCKHVAAVHQAFDLKSQTGALVTFGDRRAMASIAVGESEVSKYSLPVSAEKKSGKIEIFDNDVDNICMSPCVSPENTASEAQSNVMKLDKNDDAISSRKSTIHEMLMAMKNLHQKFGSSDSAQKAVSKLAIRLKEIKTGEDWVNFMHSAVKSPPRKRLISKRRRKLQIPLRPVSVKNSDNVTIKK